jgi:hypothetical protein
MPLARQVLPQLVAVRQLLAELAQHLARLERSLRPHGDGRVPRSTKPAAPSRPQRSSR